MHGTKKANIVSLQCCLLGVVGCECVSMNALGMISACVRIQDTFFAASFRLVSEYSEAFYTARMERKRLAFVSLSYLG